jgi:hypothetical protein
VPLIVVSAISLFGIVPSLSEYRSEARRANKIFQDAVDTVQQNTANHGAVHIVSAKSSQQDATNDARNAPRQGSLGLLQKQHTLAAEASTNSVKKPWLVIHIGPSKTATTSIQCGLQEYSLQLRGLDNYYYMGIACPGHGRTPIMPNNETALRFFELAGFMNWPQMTDTSILEQFLPRLDYHRRHGHNVIVSSEHFVENLNVTAHERWRKVKNMFQGFRVKAIVVSRNLVDWFPSYYYQRFLGEAKAAPPIQSFLLESLKAWEQGEDFTSHGFRAHRDHRKALKMWSSYFDLDVMDFYASDYEGDVVHNLVCEFIPNAAGTCNLLNQVKQDHKEFAVNVTLHNNGKRGKATVIHARKSKSVHETRVQFFAEQTHQYLNATEMTDRELRQVRAKKLAHINGVLDHHGILLQGSVFLHCLSPELESRLKSISTSFMQAYHKQQFGTTMTDIELETAIINQDDLFEKNRMKYCDLNLERLFGNITIKEHLLQGMVPKSK